MRIDKTIGIIGGIFILAGIGSMLFLPGEKKGIKMQISVWIRSRYIRCDHGGDITENK